MSRADNGYKSPVLVPQSGNQWIDGLTDGYRWGTSVENPAVGFTFISDTSDKPRGEFGGYPSWGWSHAERQLMEKAMDSIASVSGLQFINRGDDNDDEVEIWFYNLDRRNSEGSYGFAYTPGSDPDEGLVAINWSTYQNKDGSFKNSIASGSFHGVTFLHELCHAVGLKHPHDRGIHGEPHFPGLTGKSDEFKNAGEFGQNSHPWMQLIYVDKGARSGLVPKRKESHGFLQSPGALDVAALQWMYGINDQTATEDDVYRLPLKNQEGIGWQCIWDTGGIDRIDGSHAKRPVSIDLRNATLDSSESAGGYVSRVRGVYGGFTISHDWNGHDFGVSAGLCVIENATGGKSDDLLIGNNASNRLKGKKGDDVLYASTGSKNRLIGGKGRDKFLIDSDQEAFVVVKDFNHQKDRLVFDIPPASVTVQSYKIHSKVFVEDRLVAKISNSMHTDVTQSMMFKTFENFGL